MTATLVTGIGLLVTHDVERPELTDAALVVEDGAVAWVGEAADAPVADEALDVEGRCVIPGFVDSHSHVVFAGDRADEFEARMAGRRYEAGGIRRTVRLTRAASDEDLLAGARRLVAEARAQGTTTIEIKSGYGLTVREVQAAATSPATTSSTPAP
jgi:imidazolonepropionase